MEEIDKIFDYNTNFKTDSDVYREHYEPRLNLFLKKFFDNSEILFIDKELELCKNQIKEIKESITGIEYHSELRNEYLSFFMNRLLPFEPEKYDKENHTVKLSEEGKLMRYSKELSTLLSNRIATNYKILDFLKNRRNKISQVKNLIQKSEEKTEKNFPKYCQVGSLFAQGLITKKGHEYYFKNKSFDSITSLSRYIKNEVLKTKNSIRQYINDTLNPRDTSGNKDFYQSKLMTRNVIDFCKENSIKITDEFQSIYTKLENQH